MADAEAPDGKQQQVNGLALPGRSVIDVLRVKNMAGKKTTTSKTVGGNGKNGAYAKKNVAASALTQSPSHRPDGRARRSPSADELGRRAWEASYKNRHKS